eukprot:1063724-Heterocapsa_arctica.AAC.1
MSYSTSSSWGLPSISQSLRRKLILSIWLCLKGAPRRSCFRAEGLPCADNAAVSEHWSMRCWEERQTPHR